MTISYLKIGQRIEIPAHFDLWMRGARFGVVSSIRHDAAGEYTYYIKMDHSHVRKRVKLLWPDLEYVRVI